MKIYRNKKIGDRQTDRYADGENEYVRERKKGK